MQPSSPIPLAQGASTIVTVVLTPPPATPANTYPATVRATSRSSASVFQDVIDTTTIQAAAVPQITSVITPSNADQGAPVTIAYTVTNVGNVRWHIQSELHATARLDGYASRARIGHSSI